MTKTKKSTLEQLKAQQAILTARIQAAEARERIQERKRETQRKILVGAYYLNESRKNNQLESLKRLMDSYLTRKSDRALFGLTEREEGKE